MNKMLRCIERKKEEREVEVEEDVGKILYVGQKKKSK